MESIKVVIPRSKSKRKIIFKASFANKYKKGGDLDEILAQTLGSFSVF